MNALILQSPGAVAFHIGSFTVRWYGVMIATGFLVATYCASLLAQARGIDKDKVLNCCLVSFIGGIIGARLYFVALNWTAFSQHPEEIMATWLGGLSLHGGMIGALLTGWLYCRIANLPFATTCDIVASCAPIAQAIGRWGNFFNSEAFGHPTPDNFPIKLFIPKENRPAIFTDADYFHATFLYESIWDLGMFLVLYFYVFPRTSKYPLITFLSYISIYSVGRLLIEPLRTDSLMVGSMPAPIVASMVLLAASLLGLILLWSRYHARGEKN